MIYLFCNEKYGKAFLTTAQRFSRQYAVEITVVFSGRKTWPKNFLRRVFVSLSDRIRCLRKERRFRREVGMRLRIVRDVNCAPFLKRIRSLDQGIVAGFNQIFKVETLSRFKGMVNFHPSLLPFYRGPVPSYWCIQNGEDKTGFTLHRMTDEVDAGECLFQEEVDIQDIQDPEILDEKISQRAAPVLWSYLEHLTQGKAWNKVEVDARKVYRKAVDYASFPKVVR